MDTKNTAKKLPDSFGDTVMEFAKLSTDAYRNGSIQGQLKVLEAKRNDGVTGYIDFISWQ